MMKSNATLFAKESHTQGARWPATAAGLLVTMALLWVPIALAQAPIFYTVPDAGVTNTQAIDGNVSGLPNAADIDGLLFSRSVVDYDGLTVERDVLWFQPTGGFNQKYEHLRVEGNDKSTDILEIRGLRATGIVDCSPWDFRIRSLEIRDAAVDISDQETIGSSGACRQPVNFYITSDDPSVAADLTLDNGILNLNARPLLVQSVPFTMTASSGVSTLRAPGANSLGASTLQIDVDPGAELKIVSSSGMTRIYAPPNFALDNSVLEISGEVAGGNLVWGSSSRSGQNFIASNGGTLRVGDGVTTVRFGLEFASDEGIQVASSLVEVGAFGTLSSPLLLDNGNVEIAANGHLLSSVMHSMGNSFLIADATALESNIGSLRVDSGNLVISGKSTAIDSKNTFSLVQGSLQLGRPGDINRSIIRFTGDQPGIEIKPNADIFFAAGSKLSGVGSFDMNTFFRALQFESNATLSPGYSVGDIDITGQLLLEDGAIYAAELDLSATSSGQISSDRVQLLPPFGQLSLGLGNGTVLDLTVLNDAAVAPGSKATLVTYPAAANWNGATFAGLPNGAVFQEGANYWQINYDELLLPGLPAVTVRGITLTVVASNLTVTPSSTVYPPQLENTPSAEQTITISNTGLAPLPLTTITSSNPDYALTTDNCTGTTLNFNDQCTVGFAFTPTTAGQVTSDLTVNGQVVGALIGEGVPGISNGVSLTPNLLDFGNVDISTTAGPLDIVLNNASGVALNPLTVTVVGSAQFTETNTCGASLANAANCTLQVSFTPTNDGLDAAILRVFDNGVKIAEAALLGTGISEPQVTLNPTALAYGDQAVGVASAPRQVSVENSGTADLLVSSINTSGGDYTIIADTCTGTPVAAGNSCTLDVVFTPSVIGSDPAGISLRSNATSSPNSLSISGNGVGPDLSFDRTDIVFAPQIVGVASSPEAVMVTNTGNANLDITGLSSSATEFSIVSDSCAGQSLGAGATCSFAVVLTGDAEHTANGVITLVSNALAASTYVQVSGAVAAPPPAAPTPVPTMNRTVLALLTLLALVMGMLGRRRITGWNNEASN